MQHNFIIRVDSLPGWATDLNNQEKWGEMLDRMPDAMLKEWKDVVDGKIQLETPDGNRRGVVISGTVAEPQMLEVISECLFDYIIDHKALSDHEGPGVPALLWNTKTLDRTHVFCIACCRFIDLSICARVFDDDARERHPDD